MANSNLYEIQAKVRRLTRTPSESQLTTAAINQYINTFVLYDFPEHLRLFTLDTTFTFWTTPYVDTYDSAALSGPDPTAIPFKDKYTSLTSPLFIAGYQGRIYQDLNTFYSVYPANSFMVQIGTGDGVSTQFTATLNQHPILQNDVTFNSVDSTGAALIMHDVPVVDATTNVPTLVGNLYAPGLEPTSPPTVALPTNSVDYFSGTYIVTFASPPAANAKVWAQTVPYTAARPQIMLWYANVITLRPVPDNSYQVTVGAFIRPTELLDTHPDPELQQWWQYIAYGAAIKVLQDRMDTDTVAQIMPEFKKQETLVLRRTIVNQTKERVSTIYTDQTNNGNAYNGFYGNGGI